MERTYKRPAGGNFKPLMVTGTVATGGKADDILDRKAALSTRLERAKRMQPREVRRDTSFDSDFFTFRVGNWWNNLRSRQNSVRSKRRKGQYAVWPKYRGAEIRQMNKLHGVGRPPKKEGSQ